MEEKEAKEAKVFTKLDRSAHRELKILSARLGLNLSDTVKRICLEREGYTVGSGRIGASSGNPVEVSKPVEKPVENPRSSVVEKSEWDLYMERQGRTPKKTAKSKFGR